MNKNPIPTALSEHDRRRLRMNSQPRFEQVFCSQCGGSFGPGDAGFSSCADHNSDAAEVARLRQALRDIADPIAAWQRDLQEGYTLDGAACVRMADDPETYKRMAREALRA